MRSNNIKFLISSSDIANIFQELVEKSDDIYLSVAWTTAGHESYKILKNNKHKIRRFFCGIKRNLTSPIVLKDFQQDESFRIVDDHELFHHKVYLFKYKNNKGLTIWESLIGSANFTDGGFCNNYELVQHTKYDYLLDLHEKIEDLLFCKSKRFSLEDIKKYEQSYNEAASKENTENKKRSYQNTTFYGLSWKDYLSKVQSDPHHSLDGRLELLKTVQELLGNNNFCDLSEIDRKKIAGTYSDRLEANEQYDSKWFGGMSGAGQFSGNVIAKPEGISEAMNLIPRMGVVTENHYKEFMNLMIPASGYKNDPLAVSTRMLAMLRPDYFFCATSANTELLAKDLKFKKTTLSIDNYWSIVVEPLINSDWWKVQFFTNKREELIWKSRVALLDILYYNPKFNN